MVSVAACEEFHQLIRIFSSDQRNLPIVRGIGDLFSNLFSYNPRSRHCGRNDALSPSIVENLIVPVEESCEVDVRRLFPKQKEYRNYDDERNPHAVFNMLDMVLMETMERLKKLREGFRVLRRCSFNEGIATVLPSGFRLASDSDGALIRTLCTSGKVKAALELHSNLLGNYMVPDLYTYNFLMNVLCKMGHLLTATCLLERMAGFGVSPNIVTYNTLVEGCCHWGHMDMALDLVSSVSQSGVSPDIVTFNILVHALCIRGLHSEIHSEKLLAEILEEHNKESNVVTSTILMDGCCRQGDVVQALELWNEMFEKGMRIDRIAFNVLINGFCLVHDMKAAYRYFSEMFKRGFLPDVVTLNTLISGFAREGNINEACDIHHRMELAGPQPDHISYKSVIQGLCHQGDISKAVEFLHKMLDVQLAPDPRIWNLIITGYGRYGDVNGAFSIRDMMVSMGVVPNIFTYNALIHAHVKVGNRRQALLLKKEMLANGVFPDAVTYNLLIRVAFNSEYNADPLIPKMWNFHPDVFTYTEWIKGLCLQRRLLEAGMMLNKLLRSGLPIDHVPFQILIKTYCKRGKVVEALDIYEKMTRKQFEDNPGEDIEQAILNGIPSLKIYNSHVTSNFSEWVLGFCGGVVGSENPCFPSYTTYLLKDITTLDLSNRIIHWLPQAFTPTAMPSLSHLNLRGNQLDETSVGDLLELLSGFTFLNELEPRLPQWTYNEPLEERIIGAMWLYLMTYRLADEEKIDETSVWYVMDELGSALRHSDEANFRVAPFLFMPEGKLASAVSFSVLWPIQNVCKGEECTRDFLFGIGEDKHCSARLTAWFHTPESYFIEEFKKYSQLLNSVIPHQPSSEAPTTRSILPGDGHVLQVYTDIPHVEENLTRPEFVLTLDSCRWRESFSALVCVI